MHEHDPDTTQIVLLYCPVQRAPAIHVQSVQIFGRKFATGGKDLLGEGTGVDRRKEVEEKRVSIECIVAACVQVVTFDPCWALATRSATRGRRQETRNRKGSAVVRTWQQASAPEKQAMCSPVSPFLFLILRLYPASMSDESLLASPDRQLQCTCRSPRTRSQNQTRVCTRACTHMRTPTFSEHRGLAVEINSVNFAIV